VDTGVAVLGERASIDELYRSEAEKMFRALYAFCGDIDIASDAVAEAFTQLIRRGPSVHDPAGWTWRTAFRITRGVLKDRSVVAATRPVPNSYTDRYANPDLIAALRKLPDGQRSAVILFYYADLPVAEIARRIGSNGIAVRANLTRGRRNLRRLLGDDHG
jgi:RNA polymerase sigma-70 factor (ECF subfamily)